MGLWILWKKPIKMGQVGKLNQLIYITKKKIELQSSNDLQVNLSHFVSLMRISEMI